MRWRSFPDVLCQEDAEETAADYAHILKTYPAEQLSSWDDFYGRMVLECKRQFSLCLFIFQSRYGGAAAGRTRSCHGRDDGNSTDWCWRNGQFFSADARPALICRCSADLLRRPTPPRLRLSRFKEEIPTDAFTVGLAAACATRILLLWVKSEIEDMRR